MKKALVFVLAVVMVMAMAVPAYAVEAVADKKNSPTFGIVEELPELVEVDADVTVELVPVSDAARKLNQKQMDDYAAAQETLEEAVPEGMKTLYFFYVLVHKDNAEEKVEPFSMTLKIDDVEQVVAKQFINNAWVELAVSMNIDGTITIKGVQEGPMAVFGK